MSKFFREQFVRLRLPVQFLLVFALSFTNYEFWSRLGIREALNCIDKTAQNSCDAYALDGWAVGSLGAILIVFAGSAFIIGRYVYVRNRKEQKCLA